MCKTNVPIERPSLYDTMWLINRVMAERPLFQAAIRVVRELLDTRLISLSWLPLVKFVQMPLQHVVIPVTHGCFIASQNVTIKQQEYCYITEPS